MKAAFLKIKIKHSWDAPPTHINCSITFYTQLLYGIKFYQVFLYNLIDVFDKTVNNFTQIRSV